MKKILLVFGSGGFLGSGVTKELLKHNYDLVYLFDRKEQKDIEEGENVKFIKVGDLSDEKEVESAFNKMRHIEDARYFLYSTIGGFYASPIVDTDYEKWLFMVKINLNISFLLAKHFIRLVAKSKGGSICFTSAMTGLQDGAGKSAYGTSKAALIYFTKSLAEEGKSINLTANVIAPFALDSSENREWVEDKKKLSKPSDIGRLIQNIFDNFEMYNGIIFEHKGALSND